MNHNININKEISTFQDELSKSIAVSPFKQQNAGTAPKAFVLNIVLKFGAPVEILTDQGSKFVSNLFKNTCKLPRIKKIQSTTFHPDRVLAEYLRHYVYKDLSNQDKFVPYTIYVYNTITHTATECTPFKLVYGFKSAYNTITRTTSQN